MKNKKLWPCLLVAPLAVLVMMTVVFLEGGFFPFGDKTVSWCDMDQQVVPLLCELKDLLSGREGFFLNHTNMGGMNYWGVFFFFLASPFSFLVAFVEKAHIMRFMNLLTALKLMTSAFTAALYFCRRAVREGRNKWTGVLLAVLYAFSVYALMYYQNSIWLDEMYLLPLLVMSMDALKEKKFWPYTVVITLMVAMNYYVGFMIAVFVMFRMGLFFVLEPHKNKKETAWCFIGGSLAALALSSVSWLPSLMQYLGSARTTGILDNLAGAAFEEHLNTTIPLLFSLGSVAAVLLVNLFWPAPQKRRQWADLIMLLLLVVPVFIKPIDLLWHAGSYMSFPCRYAFILTFEALICLYNALGGGEKNRVKSPLWAKAILGVAAAAATGAFIWVLTDFGKKHASEMTAYIETLWGSDRALKWLAIAFALCIAVYLILYLCRRLNVNRALCLSMAALCVAAECMFSLNVYMGLLNTSTAKYESYMELESHLRTGNTFERIKSDDYVAKENWEGMLGMPAAAHYTSLSSENWLYTMKRLGYNGYWMKIGTYGGTLFSDALLAMRNTVGSRSDASDMTYYRNDRFALSRTEYFLPLGLLTQKPLDFVPMEETGRIEYQEALFETLFPNAGRLFTEYTADSPDDATAVWRIRVDGTQELYFDAFGDYTTRLNEPINSAFAVYVNGSRVRGEYPTQQHNHILDLGTFSNEVVTVKVVRSKNVTLSSFGVYGLDRDILESVCLSARAVNFKAVPNGFSGYIHTVAKQQVLLSVPFQEGYRITVDGALVAPYEAFGGFLAFELPEGGGQIEIRFTPPLFNLSVLISGGTLAVLLILSLLAAVGVFRRKKKEAPGLALVLAKISLPLMFLAFYVFPVVWNLIR